MPSSVSQERLSRRTPIAPLHRGDDRSVWRVGDRSAELNLSWETLEGIVKHNGPLTDADGKPAGKYRESGVPQGMRGLQRVERSRAVEHASVEAQVRRDRGRHRLRRA